MSRPSRPVEKLARSVGLTLGSGSAGLLGVLLAVHRPAAAVLGTVAFAAAALLANGVVSAIESVYQHRAGIIKARGDAQVECITAKRDAATQLIKAESEARALLMRTEARVKLLDAGKNPQRHEQVIALLRQQSLDATLPDGPRLGSDDLARLLAEPTGNPPDRGPRGLSVVPDG
jgi:hypothetical protein